MCQTFYVNETGHCDTGYKVVKKSYECSTDNDCLNSRGIPSTCGCTTDPTKPKVCSAGPEDYEWVLVRDAFVKYLIGTLNCHPARGISECMRSDLYNDFKCKEIKAQYFTLLLNAKNTCLKDVKNGNDIFSLYNLYCNHCPFSPSVALFILILYIVCLH